MSLLLAAALAVAPVTLPTCSWDRPGANPFVGDVVAAVDRYTDIPPAVRKTLQARMAARQYDEIASISRDAITGQQRYRPEIRDMHFGQGTVCKTVTRKKWPEAAIERGLVYCESGHCLIVPTVCRNLSRVTRLPARTAAAADGVPAPQANAGGAAGAGGQETAKAAAAATEGELLFDSPGAGASFAQRASANAPADGGGGLTAGAAPLAGDSPVPGTGLGAAVGGGANGPAPVGVAGAESAGAPGGATGGGGGGGPPVQGISPFTTGSGGGGGSGLIAPTALQSTISPVPEPGSWALMSLGALAVFGAVRLRQRRR